jgi:DNA polymerase-3 subunit alpha
LLAENETGYRNLVKLISAAHLDGFYYRPRIDKDLLASHADGLIGLSGCLASEINSALQSGNVEKAQNLTAEYRDIFGPRNFFIELHDHGMAEQKQCNCASAEIRPRIRARSGRGQRRSLPPAQRSPSTRRSSLYQHRYEN